MAYIALYRKYRPQMFTDVVGQHQVSDTLMRAVREDKVAHAYLFAGPRGTGKTSMAKIFARAINCEQGPTDHPCNECTSCKQVLSGQAMDVLEIDAASNRGIDEIRALRESVKFMPVEGRKKIFIIDEAHMLTTEAWNALLKTIEEPPAHVIFIFATTEIEKLPVTIVSRCQRYTFRRITADDITGRLLYVAEQEHIALTEGAARLIAIHADGGLRDALSILDQCSGMATGEITPSVVENLIGLVSKAWIIQFVQDIRSGNAPQVLIYIQQALAEGRDAMQIMESFINHVRALLVAKVAPDAEELKTYDGFKESFLVQAQNVTFEELNQFIRQGQSILNDAKLVDNPRTIIEIGLLVICARITESDQSLESRVATLERSDRAEQEGLMNRLAQLEHGGIVPAAVQASSTPVQGATSFKSVAPTTTVAPSFNAATPVAPPTTSDYDFVPPPMDEYESAVIEPAVPMEPPSGAANANVGMTPPGVGSIPPPSVGSMPPKSKTGSTAGLTPPPLPTDKENAPQGALTAPQRVNTMGVTSTGKGAVITDSIVPSNEYRTIQGNVVKYLKDSNKAMGSVVLGQGQLIYVDKERAVVAFKTDLHINVLSGPPHDADVAHAFQIILGYPVKVEAVGAGTPEDTAYRQAVSGKKPSAAPAAPQEITVASQQEISGDSTFSKVIASKKWDPHNMSAEEKANPLLRGTLEKLAEDHDIYVEYIED